MSTAKKFGRRYPWDEWFNLGRVYLRRRTERSKGDFNGRGDTFAIQAYTAAKQRGKRVSVEIHSNGDVTLTMREV